MSVNDERLGRVWRFLSDYPTDFVLAYGEKSKEAGPELELKLAWSRRVMTQEEYAKIAPKYQKLAAYCYRCQRNFILEKKKKNPSGEMTPLPPNSLGQRRWHLVIAAGPIRRDGYVIITRIAAKEAREVRKLIREIQITFLGAGFFLRPSTHLYLLLKSVKRRVEIAA